VIEKNLFSCYNNFKYYKSKHKDMTQKGTFLQRISVRKGALALASFLVVASAGSYALASNTSNFQLTINPGTLSIDIVNGSYVTVASPTVVFGAVTTGFSCQTPGATGTFGTATQKLYIANPDAADNGWTASLAASDPTDEWSDTVPLDFNDPTGTPSGCADGADADSSKGKMTVNASGATLANGQCTGCNTSNVTLGSSASFSEGVLDSVTVASAAAAANDIADYTVQGVAVSQTIPSSQPASSGYDINMVLSIVAL